MHSHSPLVNRCFEIAQRNLAGTRVLSPPSVDLHGVRVRARANSTIKTNLVPRSSSRLPSAQAAHLHKRESGVAFPLYGTRISLLFFFSFLLVSFSLLCPPSSTGLRYFPSLPLYLVSVPLAGLQARLARFLGVFSKLDVREAFPS